MKLSKILFVGLSVATLALIPVCGSDSSDDDDDDSSSSEAIENPTYSNVASIVSASCGTGVASSCHGSSNSSRSDITNEAGLIAEAEDSATRIRSGNMPQSPGEISATNKTTLLNYLDAQ